MSKLTSLVKSGKHKINKTKAEEPAVGEQKLPESTGPNASRGFLGRPDPAVSREFLGRSDSNASRGFLGRPDPTVIN